MYRLAACLLALATLLPAAPATAAVDYTLPDADAVAVADGRRYPVRVTDLLYGVARRSDDQLGYDPFVQALVENQVMAKQALREFPRDQLLDGGRVGFSPETQLEDQYVAVLRAGFFSGIDAYVKQLPGASLDSLLVERYKSGDPAVAALMRLENRAEVRLTPAQLEQSGKVVLGKARMPDGSTTAITFRDVYERQNVQGRDRLLQDRDHAYLDQQLRRRVDTLFVLWWAANKSGFTAQDLALVRAVTEEKKLKDGWMLVRGVATAMHEDKPAALQKLESAVTQAEINAWYRDNREEFRQVDRVRARHVRCADEQACLQARAALGRGESFDAVARRYSIAPDRDGERPGDLGWIQRKPSGLSWLETVALIQPPGQPSPPIRSPEDAAGKAAWEIVLVEERVDGYSAPDSETVRYIARQAVAKRKAIDGFRAQQARLVTEARARYNGPLLRQRTAANPVRIGPPRPPVQDDGHGHGHGHRH